MQPLCCICLSALCDSAAVVLCVSFSTLWWCGFCVVSVCTMWRCSYFAVCLSALCDSAAVVLCVCLLALCEGAATVLCVSVSTLWWCSRCVMCVCQHCVKVQLQPLCWLMLVMKRCHQSQQLLVTDCVRHPALPALSLRTPLMNWVCQPSRITLHYWTVNAVLLSRHSSIVPTCCPSQQGCARGLFSWDRGKKPETKAKTKTFSLEAEARPRRLKFQPRQDRGEALLRLETASRLRRQDQGHIPASQ